MRSKPLVFLMNRTPVFLPVDRRYSPNHFWALAVEGVWRCGLSAYAVRLLGAVREVEWNVGPGSRVTCGQMLGTIEGSKAVRDWNAPLDGQLVRFNLEVLLDPGLLNSDPYQAAWLFEIAASAPALLAPDAYLAHVEADWPQACRALPPQPS